jgi:hypothetical protein
LVSRLLVKDASPLRGRIDRRPGAVRFGISNSSAELAILQRRSAEPGRRPRFDIAGPWRGSPARRRVRQRAERTARTAAPQTRRNAVARIGQCHFTGSMNFGTTPWGTVGKREPQIILQTDERSAILELGRENSPPNQTVGMRTGFSSRGDSFRTGSRTGAGAEPPACGPAAGGGTAPMLFSGRLKTALHSGDTVTETALRPSSRRYPWPIRDGERACW